MGSLEMSCTIKAGQTTDPSTNSRTNPRSGTVDAIPDTVFVCRGGYFWCCLSLENPRHCTSSGPTGSARLVVLSSDNFSGGGEFYGRTDLVGSVSRTTFDAKGREEYYDATNRSRHMFLSVKKSRPAHVSVWG
jgi:hypothetical protein